MDIIIEIYNILLRFVCCFISKKQLRKAIRKKYLKKTKLELFQDNIKFHIDTRFCQFVNSFYKPQDIICNDYNLKLIQTANELLLREFKRICESNNIEYWLDWGTLLGAVRHGGFIPWDDDVDVSMTRSNFSKFIEAVKKENRFEVIECLHLDSCSDNCKINKFCFSNNSLHNYIDIFLYDYCDCSEPKKFFSFFLNNKSFMSNELLRLNMPQYSWRTCNNKQDKVKIDKVFNRYINLYAGKTKGDYLIYGIECPRSTYQNILSVDVVFPLTKVKFCEVEYSAPHDIHTFLENCYGNYMKIPVDIGLLKHKPYTSKEIFNITTFLNAINQEKK